MRILLASTFLVLGTPALAQDEPLRASEKAQDVADRLNDPVMQAALAGGMEAMVQSVLDMRVDGIAKAVEPLTGRPSAMRGKTVRDLAARDDPYFDERVHESTRKMVAGTGAMASGLAAAMPELEAAMRKMGDAMERVRDRIPDGY
ncbi:MAG: hypothetical protein ACKOPR_04475 [Chakrabartia godavariana]